MPLRTIFAVETGREHVRGSVESNVRTVSLQFEDARVPNVSDGRSIKDTRPLGESRAELFRRRDVRSGDVGRRLRESR